MSGKSAGLRRWFNENWVDLSRPKKGGGFEPCGRPDASKGYYPKCVPAARAAKMTPEQIQSAISRKRRAESTQRREDKKPIMVSTLKKKDIPADPELYARVKSEAKKKFDVYPSAYANGWLVQEYKRRGGKYKRVSVSKANPYHDEGGRFTSRDKAVRGSRWIVAGSDAPRKGRLKPLENDSIVSRFGGRALSREEYFGLSEQVDEKAKSLTPDERVSLEHYHGDNYTGINRILRESGEPEFEEWRRGSSRYWEMMDVHVSNMETAYPKLAVELPRETVVYRGVFVPKGQEFQVGDVIHDRAYASTSTDSMVAARFSGTGGSKARRKPKGTTSTVLAIVLPKGKKVIVGGSHTPYRGEREILMDKGQKMRVVSVEKWTDPVERVSAELVTLEIVE